MENILKELRTCWEGTSKEEINSFVSLLSEEKYSEIVGLGAGRMGYSLRAFIMRLTHLGFAGYMIGDTNVPRVSASSIVLINSSSGETPSILLYAKQAKKAGAKLLLLTANPNSKIAEISDCIITIPNVCTEQLMKTIFEQYSFILFDYIASEILCKKSLDVSYVNNNHSILE